MTKSGLYDFLANEKLGVLGTLSPDGKPQSALVGIAVMPELEIVFDTVKSSRKYRNLMSNTTACFTIGWSGERTVQYEGDAFQPAASELERYQKVYFSQWPDGPSRLSWPGITYFVIRADWIRYSDFEKRPPEIEEFTF